MKITTGNLEIIYSGLARNAFSNNIKFDFGGLWVEFNFLSDAKEYRSEYLPSEDSLGLKINLYNSNSTLGAGLSQPIKIGTFEGYELWLAYRTFKTFKEANNSWTLEYVFYKGAEVNE